MESNRVVKLLGSRLYFSTSLYPLDEWPNLMNKLKPRAISLALFECQPTRLSEALERWRSIILEVAH